MFSLRKIIYIAFCLFAISAVYALNGCGAKQDAPASPPASQTLAPEAQSAMQAQQQADATDRAAHMPPPPKKP